MRPYVRAGALLAFALLVALPTSAVSLRTDPGHVRLCENCGRILYWLDY